MEDADNIDFFFAQTNDWLDVGRFNRSSHIVYGVFNSLMLVDTDTFNQLLPLLPKTFDTWIAGYELPDNAREAMDIAYQQALAHKQVQMVLDDALSQPVEAKEKVTLLFDAFLQYVSDKGWRSRIFKYQGGLNRRSPVQTDYVQRLLQQPSAVRQELITRLLMSVPRFDEITSGKNIDGYWDFPPPVPSILLVLEALVASEIPLSEMLENLLIRWFSLYTTIHIDHTPVIQNLVIKLLNTHKLPPDLVTTLRSRYGDDTMYDPYGKVKELRQALKDPSYYLLNTGEAWVDVVLGVIDEEPAWRNVILHALKAKTAKPTKTWLETAPKVLEGVKQPEKILEFLALVGQPRSVLAEQTGDESSGAGLLFDKYNNNAARGLAWMAACIDHPDTARVLAKLVETSLKKDPGIGPRSPKLATAGVYALSLLDSDTAVTQLAYLKSRVTFKTTLKQIEKALQTAADRASVSKEDLEEMSVPTFGLSSDGTRTVPFGEAKAELSVLNGEVTLVYFNAKGKQVKAPPASVKQDFADELKELKATVKDIGKMLSATVARIEKHHLSQKTWAYDVWLERYIHSPIAAAVAKRLIWQFAWHNTHVAGIWYEGGIQDLQGNPLKMPAEATVSLWHPLHVTTDEVLAWRDWLQARHIRQPWKQAHREIYLLTDAERETATYSNRYAAHVLKQHQFNQLCALRGWRNQLRLAVDDTYQPAHIELPQWNLRAEYWIDGIGAYGNDTTETGTYLWVATDQVRFYPLHAPHNYSQAGESAYAPPWDATQVINPLPLADIPPLVFSEVMRDVDLFVGVASVGNDPTWQDGGPEGRFIEYWHYYGFGDLNESAQSRKEVLEQLLPRLKICDRVSLEGKFLHVQGDIRTYKIHLGSGNILMKPNDQYLCIVPDARLNKKGSDVFLPFEGDRTLSLILSKAFLLAEDTKIKDSVIMNQIKRD